MSLFSMIKGLFHTAGADLARVQVGFASADRFVSVLLGQAQAVGGLLEAVDPAVGQPVMAGVASVTALRGSVQAAVASLAPGGHNLAAVAQDVAALTAHAVDVAAMVAPFYRVVANDVATAAAAVAAQAVLADQVVAVRHGAVAP